MKAKIIKCRKIEVETIKRFASRVRFNEIVSEYNKYMETIEKPLPEGVEIILSFDER